MELTLGMGDPSTSQRRRARRNPPRRSPRTSPRTSRRHQFAGCEGSWRRTSAAPSPSRNWSSSPPTPRGRSMEPLAR